MVELWDRYMHELGNDECYCDFAAREFFGCFDRAHVAPCPQAERRAAGQCERCGQTLPHAHGPEPETTVPAPCPCQKQERDDG